jgi:peroxiredoxin (alkyl hydroperoxide reductase subunit C)
MLVVGARAPEFDLPGVRGSAVDRYRPSDFRGRWLVAFFYPADFSFVCPTEVRGFHDRAEEFASAGCGILGLSVDPPETHIAWARELGGIDYPLLSDIDGGVCRVYGVLDESDGRAMRATFLIDPEGAIQYALVSQRNVGRSVDETRRVLEALKTGRSCPAEWRPGDPTVGP